MCLHNNKTQLGNPNEVPVFTKVIHCCSHQGERIDQRRHSSPQGFEFRIASFKVAHNLVFSNLLLCIYLLTSRQLTYRQPAQKWRIDGPALWGHLLYLLVNHAYANRYHYHLVR